MNQIEKLISATVIDGNSFARKAVFEGVQYFEVSKKHAQIIWKVFLLDKEGNNIIHPDIENGRIVVSLIRDSNKVDKNGITISKEVVIMRNPKLENESEEDYQIRVQSILTELEKTGISEFDFYYMALQKYPLPVILAQSIDLLDNLGRFDKIK